MLVFSRVLVKLVNTKSFLTLSIFQELWSEANMTEWQGWTCATHTPPTAKTNRNRDTSVFVWNPAINCSFIILPWDSESSLQRIIFAKVGSSTSSAAKMKHNETIAGVDINYLGKKWKMTVAQNGFYARRATQLHVGLYIMVCLQQIWFRGVSPHVWACSKGSVCHLSVRVPCWCKLAMYWPLDTNNSYERPS